MNTTVQIKAQGHGSSQLLASLRKAASQIFSEKATLAVAVTVAVLLWAHISIIDDHLALNRAITMDALALAPWAIAWAIRETFGTKGGEK